MTKELDLSGIKVYTKDDASTAIGLIGQDVYMYDDVDFKNYFKLNLVGIKYAKYFKYTFIGENKYGEDASYEYFILEKDAKFKEEKILRPFKDVEEFRNATGCAIGGMISYKKKDSDAEYTVLFNGYVRINDKVEGIYLGRRSYTLEELKDDYLYYKDSEWKPFGIEE